MYWCEQMGSGESHVQNVIPNSRIIWIRLPVGTKK